MKKPENNVDNALIALADAIRESDVYRRYIKARQRIEARAGLKKEIDEFRMKNFEMQQRYEGDELLSKTEEFTQTHASFREDPDVDEFLSAELSLVRMIQDLEEDLLDELDFE